MSEFVNFNTITRDNIAKLAVLIKQLISKADFISIDTEFTGLKLEQLSPEFGFDFRKWNNRNADIAERYKALKLLVSTHALVSVGMSIYKKDQNNQTNSTNSFIVNNFNFILQRQNSHLISPSSISFLADNGYDFNVQATKGIRFIAPPSKANQEFNPNQLAPPLVQPADIPSSSLSSMGANEFVKELNSSTRVQGAPGSNGSKRKRQNQNNSNAPNKRNNSGSLSNTSATEHPDGRIFGDIFLTAMRSETPLVVHNGLLDLLFLYHSFVAKLPDTIDTFIADLSHLLGGPIYDTKYLAEYETRDESTFLAYLYQKRRRQMIKNAKLGQKNISIQVCKEINLPNLTTPVKKPAFGKATTTLDQMPASTLETPNAKNNINNNSLPYCKQFASHGYCRSGNECDLSHDINLILDYRGADKNQQKQLRAAFFSSTNSSSALVSSFSPLSAPSTPALNGKSINSTNGLTNQTSPQGLSTGQSMNTNQDQNQSEFKPQTQTYHSAVFDAHMTGYIYAATALKTQLDSSKNKVYLIGKDFALTIQPSRFSKNSQDYLDFFNSKFSPV